MPTLNWIGKEAVVKHHKDVPYRLLEPVAELSCGDATSGNLIVQGDNLHALKALLPRYAGQVKCVYVDVPYNTGNENWVYNDNVNSPEIRKWLGQVVGKEGETLDRHDRWLCMMYPRLLLLKQFLRNDGAIFISIDDYALHYLRILMDEVFGANCFKNTISIRRGIKSVQAQFEDVSALAVGHEYILVYSLKPKCRFPKLMFEHEEMQPGKWDTFWRGTDRPTMRYELFGYTPDKGQWRWERNRAKEAINNYEDYLQNHADQMSLDDWYLDNLTATNKKLNFVRKNEEGSIQYYVPPRGGRLLSDNWMDILLTGGETDFETEKNTILIQRIIGWITAEEDIILDSFAGSGTTGHAVLKQNAEDGGNRKFILVEMDENIARNVTAERVRRVAQGYIKGAVQSSTSSDRTESVGAIIGPAVRPELVEGQQWIEGLGGGFQFCKLSNEPLFTPDGQIRADVTFAQLAEFVWFVETGTGFTPHPSPLPQPKVGALGRAREWPSPLIGVYEGRAIYLLYNGILKDRSVAGGNVLTGPVYESLPHHDGPKVIYAAACRLGKARLVRENIAFKQTPYALEV